MSSIGIINHIEIYVSDLKATRRFWDLLLLENLGYTIHQKWKTGVSYVLKDTYIVFVQSTHLMPAYNRTRVGLNHLAFSVSSIAQLDNIRDQLCQANYTELYTDRYPHAAGDDTFALFFEDPDQIKVEVVVYKE